MIPGLGRALGEGKDNPLQYFGLENAVDFIVHGVAKSRTLLSNFHFTSLQKNKFILLRFNVYKENFIPEGLTKPEILDMLLPTFQI